MLKNSLVAATVPCRDLQRSRQFYEGVLGLEPLMTDIPGAVVYECAPGSQIYLYETTSSGGEATRLGFATTEFDNDVSRLRTSGVSLLDYDLPSVQEGAADTGMLAKSEPGIFVDPTFGKTCWFADPDGNIISVMEAPALQKRAVA